jgi:transcriptional regulator with XRE-family HTH domain
MGRFETPLWGGAMGKRKFGQLLRAERDRAGKSMGELARHLVVSVPYVSDVERGNRSPFSQERLLRAAAFLRCDPKPLIEAAAGDKGAFELDARSVTQTGREVGAALARGWSELSDEDLEKIRTILEGTEQR